MSSKHLTKAIITNAAEKYGMSLSLEMKLDARKKASELRCAYTGHTQGFNIGSVNYADTYYRY